MPTDSPIFGGVFPPPLWVGGRTPSTPRVSKSSLLNTLPTTSGKIAGWVSPFTVHTNPTQASYLLRTGIPQNHTCHRSSLAWKYGSERAAGRLRGLGSRLGWKASPPPSSSSVLQPPLLRGCSSGASIPLLQSDGRGWAGAHLLSRPQFCSALRMPPVIFCHSWRWAYRSASVIHPGNFHTLRTPPVVSPILLLSGGSGCCATKSPSILGGTTGVQFVDAAGGEAVCGRPRLPVALGPAPAGAGGSPGPSSSGGWRCCWRCSLPPGPPCRGCAWQPRRAGPSVPCHWPMAATGAGLALAGVGSVVKPFCHLFGMYPPAPFTHRSPQDNGHPPGRGLQLRGCLRPPPGRGL